MHWFVHVLVRTRVPPLLLGKARRQPSEVFIFHPTTIIHPPSPHHPGLVVSASLAMDHHDSVDGFGVILANTFRPKDLTEIRFSAEERACEEIERLHKHAKSFRAHRV
jgi:hypothetical protein